MVSWPQVTIGELGQVFDGPHATPKTIDEGPIFLGIGALQDGRINLGETRHVTPEDFVKWTRRVRPQAGDIVFSYETRLGQVAIIPEGMKCCLGRRMGLVRADKNKILPRFFLYYFLSPFFQEFIRAHTVQGATVDRILLTDFPSFPFLCPPLSEQEGIASLLGALDDKIELNRQTNATLEAMARALFKDWFVDFGPTRAKAEGRAPYLAPHLWELFPDALDDEDKPVGWEYKQVEDILELAYGKALKSTDRVDGCIPVYGSGGITGYHNKSLVDGPSIIVGRKGTVGSLYWEDGPFFPIDTVFHVKPKAPLTFCFYLLQTLGLEGMNTDAAVPGLNRGNVYRLPVSWSQESIRFAFNAIIEPLRQKIRCNADESRTLAQTRDLLLPKLMSGEIRLHEAERIAEAVL
ncbi:restriction endonuclease subunit S [Allochromatium palmeri]|uniref:Restriction endonuclease subunit S n=1 Tax=Allochromatium palmeri TaxID=231048 RepID=A0A6N8EEK9_9GAMM|nr:restriction endonuclease subunit S [Allochromatium palmeri]MTW20774.1 restriction endonuclease subunit S [Allochromatium palmeri]